MLAAISRERFSAFTLIQTDAPPLFEARKVEELSIKQHYENRYTTGKTKDAKNLTGLKLAEIPAKSQKHQQPMNRTISKK